MDKKLSLDKTITVPLQKIKSCSVFQELDSWEFVNEVRSLVWGLESSIKKDGALEESVYQAFMNGDPALAMIHLLELHQKNGFPVSNSMCCISNVYVRLLEAIELATNLKWTPRNIQLNAEWTSTVGGQVILEKGVECILKELRHQELLEHKKENPVESPAANAALCLLKILQNILERAQFRGILTYLFTSKGGFPDLKGTILYPYCRRMDVYVPEICREFSTLKNKLCLFFHLF